MKEKGKPVTVTKIQAVKKSNKDNPDLVKIGKRLRELRIKKGYTNADFFAYEHSLSRSQINRYENSEDMRISSLLKVLKALKVSPSEFFKDFD